VSTKKHSRGCATLWQHTEELLEVGAVGSVYEQRYTKP